MDPVSYNAGYADAKGGKANAYPPVVVPPPSPSVRVIQPSENIAAVIDATPSTDGSVVKFQLIPYMTYKMAGGWAPKHGNFDLDGQEAAVLLTEPVGSSSAIAPSKPNCTFRNICFSYTTGGNFVLFRFKAPLCAAIGCSYTGPTIATFGFADVGGTQALFQGNIVPLTNSVSLYACESGCQVIGNTFHGSIGETTVRVDSPAGTTRLPVNIVISKNDIYASGQNAKGGLELRMVGIGSSVTGNIFHAAYVTVGQGKGMTTTGQSINDLTISGNIFQGVDPSIGTCLLIRNGYVNVAGNLFPVPSAAMHYPLQISGPLHLTVDTPGLYNVTVPMPSNVTVVGGSV